MSRTTVRPETDHPTSDLAAKHARLCALLDRHAAPAVALSTAPSLAWLLDGARVSVPYGGDPVLRAVVDRDGVHVHAFAQEVDRLRAEELPEGVPVTPVPWHEPLPALAADVLTESAPGVAADLRAARASLLPVERVRYRALGEQVARAVSDVLRAARPSTRERDLAAGLARAVVALGAEPVVLLVAGTNRLHHRHPLPTDAFLGSRAMAVVGARRHGLVVNLTRWVAFGADDDLERTLRLLEVEADALAATVPGRPLADVLADVAAAYPAHGFAADEWLGHHQGGPTGYAGRDPRATPTATDVVAAGQAFAWNPSACGTKVEDTMVVGDGPTEVLTADPTWPTTTVRGLARPLPLVLA